MPNTYVPDGSSFNATHELIDGADPPSAVLINTPNESLADNCEHLNLRTALDSPLIRTHTVNVIPGGVATGRRVPEDVAFDFATLTWGVVTIANAVFFDMPLNDLPNDSTLLSLSIEVRGTGYTTLPTTKPILTCKYIDAAGASNAIGSPVEDASPDVTAFNLIHPIVIPSLSVAINHEAASKLIYLNLEYDGAGQASGTAFEITRIVGSYTATKVNP